MVRLDSHDHSNVLFRKFCSICLRSSRAWFQLTQFDKQSPSSRPCLAWVNMNKKVDYLHCFGYVLLSSCFLESFNCCLGSCNEILLQSSMVSYLFLSHFLPHFFGIIEIHRHRKLLDCAIFPSLNVTLFFAFFLNLLRIWQGWLSRFVWCFGWLLYHISLILILKIIKI